MFPYVSESYFHNKTDRTCTILADAKIVNG